MKRCLLIWIPLLLLTSCFPTHQIADDIGMVTVIGYDQAEENKQNITLVLPYYKSNTEVINKVFTVEAHYMKEALDKASSKSENPLVLGQVEVITFNLELAKKGLMKYVDVFQRDPSVSTRLYVTVSEQPSQELFRQNPDLQSDLGVRLDRMIKQNIHYNILPKTNLHVFLYDYYHQGIDPFLPMISHNEHYKIEGLAFFKGDQYKGKIDYVYETLTFRILEGHLGQASMTYPLPHDTYVSLQNITSSRKVDVHSPHSTKPSVHFNMDIKAFMREYTGGKTTPAKVKEITQDIEEDMEKKCYELINKFKEWEVDPLGIEHELEMKTGDYLPEGESIYDHVDIEVNIKLNLLERGISS